MRVNSLFTINFNGTSSKYDFSVLVSSEHTTQIKHKGY
jgi:hypothetical protein